MDRQQSDRMIPIKRYMDRQQSDRMIPMYPLAPRLPKKQKQKTKKLCLWGYRKTVVMTVLNSTLN